MSYLLPPAGTEAREMMGDLAHVAEVLHPANFHRLVCFREALIQGRRTAAEPGVKRVNLICLRHDDERWLISVGKRGGWRKVWNFGKGH